MKRKKKLSKLASEIVRLRDHLELSQDAMAKLLGCSRPAVSAWEIGRAIPPPSVLLRLARKSDTAEQRAFFIAQSGLDEQMINKAAEDLFQKQMEPPPRRKIVSVPRYIVDGLDLKRSGEDVPLPAEFVPNPRSTICLTAGAAGAGPGGAPRGLYIVDRSGGDSDRLSDLLHRVVVLSFLTPDKLAFGPSGVYIGRVWVQPRALRDQEGVYLRHSWSLALLSSGIRTPHLDLCMEGTALPFDVPEPGGHSGAFNIADVHGWLEGRPEEQQMFNKAADGLLLSARVPPGSKILGEVIGRLTGHIKRERSQGK